MVSLSKCEKLMAISTGYTVTTFGDDKAVVSEDIRRINVEPQK
jgi:hypothetical protein